MIGFWNLLPKVEIEFPPTEEMKERARRERERSPIRPSDNTKGNE